ncbi:hypothetical protein J6590_029509 [Homalodisca vitripennis]|nr:hypothetical protein J6590_029509 [Homalodisca vitripennis]
MDDSECSLSHTHATRRDGEQQSVIKHIDMLAYECVGERVQAAFKWHRACGLWRGYCPSLISAGAYQRHMVPCVDITLYRLQIISAGVYLRHMVQCVDIVEITAHLCWCTRHMVPCVDIVEITAHLCWYVPDTQLANGTVCRHCRDYSSSLLLISAGAYQDIANGTVCRHCRDYSSSLLVRTRDTQLANGTVCRHCRDYSSSLLDCTRDAASKWYSV